MGKQKIEIKKIECATKRRTTFHKRSRGIIKKVKELGVLCDTEVEVTMFSPTGRREHFSNRERTQEVLQGVDQNNIPNMPEEQMTNMQVSESAQPHMPIQQQQGCAAPNGSKQLTTQGVPFAEMGNPFAMQTSAPTGPGYMRAPQTMQTSMPDPSSMQTSQVRGSFGMPFSGYTRGPLVGGRQMPLPGRASNNMTEPLVRGCQRPFSGAAQPSPSRRGLPEGEIGSNEDPPLATFKLEQGNSWMNMYNN